MFTGVGAAAVLEMGGSRASKTLPEWGRLDVAGGPEVIKHKLSTREEPRRPRSEGSKVDRAASQAPSRTRSVRGCMHSFPLRSRELGKFEGLCREY